MNKLEYLDEMYHSLLCKGKVGNKKDFASFVKVNYTTMISAFSGDERYLTNSLIAKVAAACEQGPDEIPNSSKVPIIPTEARGGCLSDFSESVHLYQCEMITSPIKGATYAIQVTGDSMAPEFPSGCQVLIKKVNEKAFIEWGKVYVLDTANGPVIKQIRKTEQDGIVECVSLNPAYQTFTIDTHFINGWYRVLMVMALK